MHIAKNKKTPAHDRNSILVLLRRRIGRAQSLYCPFAKNTDLRHAALTLAFVSGAHRADIDPLRSCDRPQSGESIGFSTSSTGPWQQSHFPGLTISIAQIVQ